MARATERAGPRESASADASSLRGVGPKFRAQGPPISRQPREAPSESGRRRRRVWVHKVGGGGGGVRDRPPREGLPPRRGVQGRPKRGRGAKDTRGPVSDRLIHHVEPLERAHRGVQAKECGNLIEGRGVGVRRGDPRAISGRGGGAEVEGMPPSVAPPREGAGIGGRGGAQPQRAVPPDVVPGLDGGPPTPAGPGALEVEPFAEAPMREVARNEAHEPGEEDRVAAGGAKEPVGGGRGAPEEFRLVD